MRATRLAEEVDRVSQSGAYVFVAFMIAAALAFPFVRDLALFEQVYTLICAPFF